MSQRAEPSAEFDVKGFVLWCRMRCCAVLYFRSEVMVLMRCALFFTCDIWAQAQMSTQGVGTLMRNTC